MATLVLSPHLDDAVLSAWSVLRAGEVEVVNVCAGAPDDGVLAFWDRLTGATSSSERMAERVAEDRRALAHLGIEPRNLGFLDAQYRDGTPLAAGELEAALEGFVAAAEAVHAPAGLGDHADHVAVREAALALAARSGVPVFLYAEQPYATRFGWPSWVTGAESTAELDPGVDWERDLANVSVGPDRLRPDVVRLPAEEAARKVHAMREYATQLPALDAVGGVSLLEVSGWEVRWELTSPNR